MLHVERRRFPTLEIVPLHADLYHESVRIAEGIIHERLRELEDELGTLGALPSERALPDHFIPGSLHEALDDYSETVRSHNVFPGTSDLKPYGRLRLERVKRFKQAHGDIPLYDLTYDACTALVVYRTTRSVGQRGPTSRLNDRHRAESAIAAALQDLTGPEWSKVRNFLADPRCLAFLDRMHRLLEAAEPRPEWRAALVWRFWLCHRRVKPADPITESIPGRGA